MTTQEAAQKALAMSRTGDVHAVETMAYYAGGKASYSYCSVKVDGFGVGDDMSCKTYEEVFEKLEAKLDQGRKDQVEKLRGQLHRAEAALGKLAPGQVDPRD